MAHKPSRAILGALAGHDVVLLACCAIVTALTVIPTAFVSGEQLLIMAGGALLTGAWIVAWRAD
jgi:hypothetical protein